MPSGRPSVWAVRATGERCAGSGSPGAGVWPERGNTGCDGGGQRAVPFPLRGGELSASVGVVQLRERRPVVTVGSGQAAVERGQRGLVSFFPLRATPVLHLRLSCPVSLNNCAAHVRVTGMKPSGVCMP